MPVFSIAGSGVSDASSTPPKTAAIDRREVSFYGRELCDGHLCPSHHFLSRAEKLTLIDLLDDWYLYGLCVTDIDLVKEYFRHIGDRLGEAPAPEMFRNGTVRAIARRFFAFKLTWPFRSPAMQTASAGSTLTAPST